MEKAVAQVTDRLSMSTFFEKLYTTREKRPPLKAFILLSELSINDFTERVQKRRKLAKIYSIKLTKLETDLYGLNLKKLIRMKTAKGYAILDLSQEGIWIVFCTEKSYFVKRALERLFIALYPDVSRLYLNYSQIHVLLDMIKDAYQGQSTLTSFTIKREPKQARRIFRERGTLQLWEENAEEELRRQSKDYQLTIDRINFEVRNERNTILLQANVSRKGICRLWFGSFSAFYENVVRKAIDLGLNWKKFYAHRARIIHEGKIWLKPFRISNQFALSKEQMHRLARKISSRYSCSIVHSGNPYFVANICDHKDGSSFGVTALGSNVTITPITRGTHQAAWKLSNRIQEILGDGNILSVMG